MSWDALDDDLDVDSLGLQPGEVVCEDCSLVHKGECF